MRILRLIFIIVILAFAVPVPAVWGGDAGPSRLVLMALSAHPDDEDGGTLAYYGKLKGVTTYSVCYTRGEGGQNEIGPELGAALGRIRTKETLEAASLLGTSVRFLGYLDFGFSKTAKESFAKWGGRDSVLARVVYVIRALKPDVIITNHDTVTASPRRQHGNHQVVGITAYEAFAKAADPSFHPEQLNDSITPWQVKKLYIRVFPRDSATAPPHLVKLDLTRRTPEGERVDEIALASLRKHRSQGMGQSVISFMAAGFSLHRYALLKSDRDYPYDSSDLFAGIAPSVRRTAQIPSFPPAPDEAPPPHAPGRTPGFTSGIRVGLVKSYDDTYEETMKALGIPFELVDSAMLAAGDLRRFSTILLDLRCYLYRSDAVRYNARLLDYARGGGNLICSYHKTGDWNGKNLAPYPITLTNERVTEETAPVAELIPRHPFFTMPNAVGEEGWEGWVQERSLYLPDDDTSKTSDHYKRLLAMSDEGEHQPSTSILWCNDGKGTYTYVSLVLYRQLRQMNEGAMKLFCNMLSQPLR